MNHDENKPDVQTWIEPELEARVVAWVAGEASAFESAELERLVGEEPELAIFKRRIEAVHGLVAVAVRPDREPLRLAPERRAKLLQTLVSGDGPTKPGVSKKADAPAVFPTYGAKQHRRKLWRRSGMIAAGLMLGLFFSTLIKYSSVNHEPEARDIRKSESVEGDSIVLKKVAAEGQSTGEKERYGRLEEMNVQLETALGRPSSSNVVEFFPADVEDSEKRRGPNPVLFGIGSPAGIISSPKNAASLDRTNVAETPRLDLEKQQALSAAVAARRSDGTPDDGAIVLSPFSVTASSDQAIGYSASSTLAGTRIATDLKDMGSAINITSQLAAALGDKSTSDNYLPSAANSSEKDTRQTAVEAESHSENGELVDAARILDAGPNVTGNFASSNKGYSGDQVRSSTLSVAEPPAVEIPILEAKSEQTREAGPKNDRAFAAQKKQISQLSESDGENSGRLQAAAPPAAAPVAITAPVSVVPEQTVEVSAAKQPVSTFSLHVSDVSFRLAQAALARGEMPAPDRIRPEEFYNAFDYGDAAPAMAEKVSCRVEQTAHPMVQQRNLVRIAMKVPSTGRGGAQPLYLTVMLDTSGSMEREDRAPVVQQAMKALASLLGPNDRLTVVGFARQPRLLVDQLSGDKANEALTAIAHTPAEGGTDLEAALKLASELALRHQVKGAQNRIVLITDGAANLGNANPAQLASSVEALRQQGIAFDACGVGLDGLDDAMLERLTRKGDGRYYVLNTPEAADAGFARQLAGAFRPAAQNVKVQVRFNQARVGAYRLIGFEQHRLREEDFRNDKVDAAELAADEAAVAVYQVETLPQGQGDVGEVYVRFRDASNGNMVERSWTLPYDPQVAAFDRASPAMQLAGVATLVAEKLRGGAVADGVKLGDLAPVVNRLRGHYRYEPRVQELVKMYEQLRRLKAE